MSIQQIQYGPLGERLRSWTINQIGMDLISTSGIFLGKLLKLPKLYFLMLITEVIRPPSWGCCEN